MIRFQLIQSVSKIWTNELEMIIIESLLATFEGELLFEAARTVAKIKSCLKPNHSETNLF